MDPVPPPDEINAVLLPDIEYRLREIIQEALKFRKHSKRQRMTTEDINSALRVRNVETLYGFSSPEPLNFRITEDGNEVVSLEDREIDFEEMITGPVPRCPIEVTMASHWMAIEGVQPAIPENPQPIAASASNAPNANGAAAKTVGETLSQELQLFFEKVTNGIKSGSDALQYAALMSLTHDAGLQPLLPYFTQFINDEVARNIRNLSLLMCLMRMARALISSPHLHIEPYLHQLMPAIMTCMVGKRLCNQPNENHWALRDYAALLVSQVVDQYGRTYNTFASRVTTTLSHAFLDPTKPLTTHYGAIVGLSALGPRVVSVYIIPNLTPYHQLLNKELESQNQRKKAEACKRAVGTVLHYFPDELCIDLIKKSQPALVPSVKPSQPPTVAAATNSSSFIWKKSKPVAAQQQQQQQQQEQQPSLASRYAELSDIFGSDLIAFHVVPPLTTAIL